MLLLHRRLRHGEGAGEEAREDSVIPVSVSNVIALNLSQGGVFTPECVKVKNNSGFTGYNVFSGSNKKKKEKKKVRKSTRVAQEGRRSLIRDRVCRRLSSLLNANTRKHETNTSKSP